MVLLSIFKFYKMSDLENSSRIEERSVITFLVAEQCKPREIFERMLLCINKHASDKKTSTNELNYSRTKKCFR